MRYVWGKLWENWSDSGGESEYDIVEGKIRQLRRWMDGVAVVNLLVYSSKIIFIFFVNLVVQWL